MKTEQKQKLEKIKADKKALRDEEARKEFLDAIAKLNGVINIKPVDITELSNQIEILNDKLDIKGELTQLLEAINKEVVVNTPNKVTVAGLQGLVDAVKNNKPISKTVDLSKFVTALKELTKEVKKQPQAQKPEDYMPYRRVIKLGNRLVFDDQGTPSRSGGGGTNTDGLATSAKQDAIITAIEESGGSTPLAVYTYIQKDTSGATYKYYGYADANTAGGWAIKRITIATNLAEYIKGTTDYTTNWAGRAGLTYADIWSTF